MTYDNIKFRKSNMTIVNSYFYMFDEDWDTLVEKTDDGSISFTHPLNIDLSRSYIEDDFDGNDGDSPNSAIWSGFDPGVTIQDNKLELHSDNTDVFEYVKSVFDVFGNFEAQVGYELITYPSTSQWQCALTIRLVDEDPFIEYRILRLYSQVYGQRYAAQDNAGGSYLVRGTITTSDISGKFRMYRNGTSLICYYWSGTSWTQFYSWTVPISRVKIVMSMWSGDTLPSATVRFDNFSFHHKLGYVRDTQYDGRNFWTHQGIENNGYVIRRWNIENHVCYLRDEFLYGDTLSATYRGNAFGVEHYITAFNCTVSGGNDVLCLNEYYDSTVASGVTLFLGPNELGEQEEVTVSEVSGPNVTVTSGIQHTYDSGDNINFYKSFFVFNDYDGLSSAEGTLYRFDAYTGEYLSSQVDFEYKDVTASTFDRVRGALLDYPDMHTLLYVKGNNAKLRNMSDLLSTKYASSVNDDFTGVDYDAPNTTRWVSTQGDPYILSNELFMSNLSGGDEDILKSNYYVFDDFDVQVSGSSNGFTGDGDFEHYMSLSFPSQPGKTCEIGFRHYSGNTTALYAEKNGSYISTVSGSNNYMLRFKRTNDSIDFYYKTMVSGIMGSWNLLDTTTMYDNDCYLYLGFTASSGITVSGTYFDDLVFTSGKIFYPSATIPYYGIMGIDNIRVDQVTVIPIYNAAIRNQTLYRLQDEATYYGVDNDWGAYYNYQVSPIRSFLDSITVAAYPVILPANGYNITKVTAVVTDQYGEGVVYKPVSFVDDDPDGYILSNPVYTDIFFGTGAATTYYRAGVIVRLVTVEGTSTQYD